MLPEGAQLDLCRPDPAVRKQVFSIGDFHVAPHEKLVTYVARNLEPYRGFHVMMRALPELLAGRPDVQGGAGRRQRGQLRRQAASRHLARAHGEGAAGQYDASRVLLPGQIGYDVYLRMLQRSDVHVYLTYPFVASWSLREALACGCAIVASDVEPVAEFISDGKNGLLVPCLDFRNVARTVLNLLEDDKLNRRLRKGARHYAEQHLDMNKTMAGMMAAIRELTKS